MKVKAVKAITTAALVVGSMVASAPVWAQAPANDPVTTLARERFTQGVEAFDKQQFTKARDLFLQSYALKRHPAILLNLGLSELRTRQPAQAANHLQQFLREHKTATLDQQQSARDGIEAAKRITGRIGVTVDVPGATIMIDGQPAGISPLADPYFVKPGSHQVLANKDGKNVTQAVTVAMNAQTEVQLALQQPGTVPMPGGPSPEPTGPGTGPMPPGPGGPGVMPPPLPPPGTMPMPEPGPTGERQGFFPWIGDTPIAIVSSSLTGVGLVGTVIFSIAAANASANTDSVTDQIRAQAAGATPGTSPYVPDNYRGPDGDPQPCGDIDNPSSLLPAQDGTNVPFYRDACNTQRDNIAAYDVNVAMAVTFGVVGVASAAFTVVYYFVDSSPDGSPPPVAVVPIIVGDVKGVSVVGSF